MPSASAPAPVAPPAAPDDSLGAALEQRVASLWWLLTSASPSDLSRTAASVLATLREEGPQRVTVLAAREAIAQPSMSQLLQRLERRGLVERQPDPADGRACRLAVTAAGDAALRGRAEARAAWLDERLAALPAGDRTRLEGALPVLDALLDAGAAA
ncbi:MAG: MarR family transcriptional regulator [Solirubrobacterales bacterium]|nr:MarR family transcriptional regulator [Solirubrobacterales bacterium]